MQSQHHHDDDGNDAELIGIDDAAHAGRNGAIVIKAKALNELRTVRIAEGRDNDGDLRQHGDQRHDPHERRSQNALASRQLYHLRRTQRRHGIALTVQNPFLQKQHQHREDHRDYRHGARKGCAGGNLAQIPFVDQYGKHLIAAADQRGRTEIRHGGHEHDQRRRKDRRQDDGQRYAANARKAVYAQRFAGFLQRTVEILQRGGGVHEYIREQLQRKYQQYALKAVDRTDIDSEGILEELRDVARLAQQQNPAVRADKGRRKHGKHYARLDHLFAPDIEAGSDIRHRQTQQHAQQRCAGADLQRIAQHLAIGGLAEELGIVRQRKMPVLKEALQKQLAEGIQDKKHAEDQYDHRDYAPVCALLAFPPERFAK